MLLNICVYLLFYINTKLLIRWKLILTFRAEIYSLKLKHSLNVLQALTQTAHTQCIVLSIKIWLKFCGKLNLWKSFLWGEAEIYRPEPLVNISYQLLVGLFSYFVTMCFRPCEDSFFVYLSSQNNVSSIYKTTRLEVFFVVWGNFAMFYVFFSSLCLILLFRIQLVLCLLNQV